MPAGQKDQGHVSRGNRPSEGQATLNKNNRYNLRNISGQGHGELGYEISYIGNGGPHRQGGMGGRVRHTAISGRHLSHV